MNVSSHLSPLGDNADNSAQINDAIRRIDHGDNSEIVLGPGLFIIEHEIKIDRPLTLRGSGIGVTTLAMGNEGAIVSIGPDQIVLKGLSLKDFSIVGQGRIKRNGTAIKATNTQDCHISSISIKDHNLGLDLYDATSARVTELSLLEMSAGCTGIRLSGGRENRFSNLRIDQSETQADVTTGSVGIDVLSCSSTQFSQVDVSNFEHGVRVHPCREGQPTNQTIELCTFTQVSVRGCKVAGFYLNAGSPNGNNGTAKLVGVSLVNCHASSNKVGIMIEKSDPRAQIDGIDFNGVSILENNAEGIIVAPSHSDNTSDGQIRNISIAHCRIAGNSAQDIGLNPAILIGSGTKNIQIIGCTIGTWGQYMISHSHGIHFQPSPLNGTSGIIVTNNLLEGAAGASVLDQAASQNKTIRGNSGFKTEFASQIFIPHGQTEATFNHFCDGVPVWISITPSDNMFGYDPPIITAITRTTFKIVLSAPAFSNKFFLFNAQVYR